MKNQSIKPLALLGGLLLATTTAKAENPYDPNSYWLGFTAGAGATLCQSVKAGFISKANGVSVFDGIRESFETDPKMTEFKDDFLVALQILKKSPDCKGLFK